MLWLNDYGRTASIIFEVYVPSDVWWAVIRSQDSRSFEAFYIPRAAHTSLAYRRTWCIGTFGVVVNNTRPSLVNIINNRLNLATWCGETIRSFRRVWQPKKKQETNICLLDVNYNNWLIDAVLIAIQIFLIFAMWHGASDGCLPFFTTDHIF